MGESEFFELRELTYEGGYDQRLLSPARGAFLFSQARSIGFGEFGCVVILSGTKQPIPGIPETRQDVTLRVELSIETRAKHHDVRMRLREPANAFGSSDEAKEPNARGARAF